MKKRILSILLVLLIIGTLFPLQAFADELNSTEPEKELKQEMATTDFDDDRPISNNVEIKNESVRDESEMHYNEVSVASDSIATEALSDSFEYVLDSDGNATIKKYKGSDTQVQVPETIDGYKVTVIAANAFANCPGLESIEIPGTITRIESYAFANDINLSSIKLSDGLTTIGEYAFSNCQSLSSIVIPDSVVKMDAGVFASCNNLFDVQLSKNLEQLDGRAFYDCDGITSIEIPSSLVKSGKAYWNFATEYGPFYDCNGLKTVTFEKGATTIPTGLFANCPGLESIEIPGTITRIESYAFANCKSLESIVIPDSVTKIDRYAFVGCGSLKNVKLSSNLTEIGREAFKDCTSLESIEIPKSIERVVSNGSGPFTGCTALKNITIEEGMTSIPGALFADSCITTIKIPNTVTYIGTDAFAGCKSLESIVIPDSVTKIDRYAFVGCGSLKNVKLSSNLTEIGREAFKDCTSLESIEIPKSIERVVSNGSGPFTGCTALKNITIEEGMTSIPGALFADSCITTIKIPNTVTYIGTDAFANCKSLESIVIPDSVTKIDRYAFGGCSSLMTISISRSVSSIANNAFENSSNVIIYCPNNSYALIYAIENELMFRTTDKFVDKDEYVLSQGDSEFYADMNAMTANGYILFTTKYDIKEIWKNNTTDKKIIIKIPNGLAVDEESLKLDGVILKNYTLNGGKLTIPVSADSGTIRFNAKANENRAVYGYAAINATKNDGEVIREIIGIVNEDAVVLTLNSQEKTSQTTVDVSGIAPASSIVELYVDGEHAGSTESSKAGLWNANIALASPEEYSRHTIEAKYVDIDGKEYIQTSEVVYNSGTPEVTSLKLYYGSNSHDNNGKYCELINNGAVIPKVYFNPINTFHFEAEVLNAEKVDKLYIVSTRNNEKKYLEATYDEDKDVFVADGYFDENNHRYVPGTISYEYTKHIEEVNVGQNVPWNDLLAGMPEGAADAATLNEKTDYDFRTKIDLAKISGDMSGVYMDAAISIYDKETHGELSDWLGVFKETNKIAEYVVNGYNDKKYILNLDYSDPSTIAMLVKDVSGSKLIKLYFDMKMDAATDPFMTDLQKYAKYQDCLSTLSTINKAASMVYEVYSVQKDMEQLREEVRSSTAYSNEAERQQALSRVDSLSIDKQKFAIMMAVLPLMVAMPAVAVGATMSAAPTILLTAMLGVISSVAPVFWEFRIGQIKGDKTQMKWIVDPSGYVYDSATNERIEGVTATAYWIEYDGSDGFWDEKPDNNDYGTLWDASEYNQNNPLYTNEEGKYAWDVPEGWWRVKYEKDGYQTTWSDWLPVAPPQMDVNIAMVKKDHTPGDLNGDGKVNVMDLIRLKRHIADGTEVVGNADVNGDGKVNVMDLIRLKRYIAGEAVDIY